MRETAKGETVLGCIGPRFFIDGLLVMVVGPSVGPNTVAGGWARVKDRWRISCRRSDQIS
jgi:hypothetical protein